MVNKYDKLNTILKRIAHVFALRYRKGHGVHSPSAFEFVSRVLFDKKDYSDYRLIEQQIKLLLKDKRFVEIVEFGAGSGVFKSNNRMVKAIARHAGTEQKMGRLLFRMAHYYQPAQIIELGTSLGISTLYLAAGLIWKGRVITAEGNKSLSDIAIQNAKSLQLNNIEFHIDRFDIFLELISINISEFVIVFIDGNHTYEASLKYFRFFKAKLKNGFIIIDDIYWSREMESAWTVIKKESEVSFDIFSAGIIMIGDMLTPHHYKIRF